MEKGTPTDLETLLLRFAEMEKEIAFLKAEIARKDKIIAGLQQRLFGSSSEKLDPAQLQLEIFKGTDKMQEFSCAMGHGG